VDLGGRRGKYRGDCDFPIRLCDAERRGKEEGLLGYLVSLIGRFFETAVWVLQRTKRGKSEVD